MREEKIMRTIITPVITPTENRMGTLVRICGRCQKTLGPHNTGGLAWLQPDCNECTEKQNEV